MHDIQVIFLNFLEIAFMSQEVNQLANEIKVRCISATKTLV